MQTSTQPHWLHLAIDSCWLSAYTTLTLHSNLIIRHLSTVVQKQCLLMIACGAISKQLNCLLWAVTPGLLHLNRIKFYGMLSFVFDMLNDLLMQLHHWLHQWRHRFIESRHLIWTPSLIFQTFCCRYFMSTHATDINQWSKLTSVNFIASG